MQDQTRMQKAKDILEALKKSERGRPDLVQRLDEFSPVRERLRLARSAQRRGLPRCLRPGAGHNGPDQGGWLYREQYTDFWNCVESYSDEKGFEEQGFDELANLLDRLLDEWEMAVREPTTATAAVRAEPRFERTGSVPGYEDEGWWQAYDSVDGVWKYVQADTAPTDQTLGWVIQSVAFPRQTAEQAAQAVAEVAEATQTILVRVRTSHPEAAAGVGEARQKQLAVEAVAAVQ